VSYIGNSPGVASQRVVTEEVIAGSTKTDFYPVGGYALGYVDVLVNGIEIDSSDFTANDGVKVTLALAAQVGDTVKIKCFLPRGLTDGYTKVEADDRYPLKFNNLSDLISATTARNNLGLGTLAVVSPTGTPDGTKFLRDDMSWQQAGFPTGTLMLFQQTAAPTGWTKQTTHNDKALRVVSGTAGSGGSLAFSSFVAQTIGATTLSIAQIPSHNHPTFFGAAWDPGGGTYPSYRNDRWGTTLNIGSQGGGDSHTHSLNMALQYVDLIIASKN
jgi:hypothetical protein